VVRGLGLFRESFEVYQDRYVLIGGTASTLLMEEAGLSFRATKDLDIVLCIETFDAEFARAFWEFVKMGGYSNRQRSTGKRLLYRFNEPSRNEYPEMLELFSRVPDALAIEDTSHLTPIPAGEEVASLSAILLDPDYYGFIHSGKRILDGLPIVGPDRLIPLKARAWLDLKDRHAAGERIDDRDVRKHRNDIVRLYSLLDPVVPVAVPDLIRDDLRRFVSILPDERGLNLPNLGLRNTTIGEIVRTLSGIFGLS